VVHAYNPSYSGGREQEDLSSKPAKANSPRPYLEKTHHIKRSGRVAQGVGPEFKPQYHKKKKKRKLFPPLCMALGLEEQCSYSFEMWFWKFFSVYG
jgi:hypothetical protein